jgi:hypothetical protein
VAAIRRPTNGPDILGCAMAIKTADITLDGEGPRFIAHAESGPGLVLDDGRGDTGMRPSELIPLAVAGWWTRGDRYLMRRATSSIRWK